MRVLVVRDSARKIFQSGAPFTPAEPYEAFREPSHPPLEGVG